MVAVGVSAVFLAGRAEAHPLRDSTLFLDVGDAAVNAELRLPAYALELALAGSAGEGNRAAAARGAGDSPRNPVSREDLSAYVGHHLGAVAATGGEPFGVRVRSLSLEASSDGNGGFVVAEVTLRPPSGAGLGSFAVTSDVITHRVATHRILVLLRFDFREGHLAGQPPTLLGVLGREAATLRVERGATSWYRGVRALFLLGVRHIAEGTDHLLFLLMLLLPAPWLADRRRHRMGARGGPFDAFVPTFKIVTAFSVGHSLTLLLGAWGALRVPARPVEVLIAVSILVTALHALRPLFLGWEPLVAALFGLIHGLAFATALAGFGFDRSLLAWSLLAFNLGVEAAQLCVVALVLPLLLLAHRAGPRSYPTVRVTGALCGALVALAWIGERGCGLPNPLTALLGPQGGGALARLAIVLGGLLLLAFAAAVAVRTGARGGAAACAISRARPSRAAPPALGVPDASAGARASGRDGLG